MYIKKSNIALAVITALALAGCGSEDEEAGGKTVVETPPPSISIKSQVLVNEPADSPIESSVPISLSKPAKKDITLNYEVTPITASAGKDFESGAGEITIPTGSISSSIPFTILADSLDEPDETFLISISDAKNATVDSNYAETIVTIRDTDPTPSGGFVADVSNVTEQTGLFSVEILIDTPSGKDIQFPFDLNGLATLSEDYKLITQSPITIKSGQTSANIEFEMLTDSIPEGGESIKIELLEPSNAELSDNNEQTIIITGDLGMNDSGVTTWFDGNSHTSTSPSSDYPGQDADFGRDANNPPDFDGHSGFSLTKIDASSNALPSNAESFDCVLDNQTGLFWEVKASEQALPALSDEALKDYIREFSDSPEYSYTNSHKQWRASNYTYLWYNPNTKENGGAAGVKGQRFVDSRYPISQSCAVPDHNSPSYNAQFQYCSTSDYIDQMNRLSVCGFKDWRLPQISELKSLHNYAVDAGDSLAPYFPNEPKGQILSSTPSADAEGAVWCLDTATGQSKFCNKNLHYKIRAVRGGAQ